MGTNYYANTVDGQNLHIGKRSGGWRFLFRGHKTQTLNIASWEDWKVLLRSGFASVEYMDAEEFIRMVEEWEPNGRVSWLPGSWTDPEGFQFYGGEFC